MKARVIMQLISEDRRSVRCRKNYVLDEFDFDKPVRLRVFELGDQVSITFIQENGREVYVPLPLAALPLNSTSRVTWLVQVNSKQLKL